MTDLAAYQMGNDAFLAAALRWLRLRLEARAKQERRDRPSLSPSPAAVEAPSDVSASGRGWFARGLRKAPEREPTALLSGPGVGDDAVARAAAAMEAAEAVDPPDMPPALAILAQQLGLSRFERDTLLLLAAMELDPGTGAACAAIDGDPARAYPTFALALSLFDDPAWDVLSPERPLRNLRLIEINQPGAQPLARSALRADERIVNFIKGMNYLDDRLSPLLTPLSDGAGDLPPSQQALVERITGGLRTARGRLPLVQLLGVDASSKQSIAARAAGALGLQLYRMPVEMLPAAWSEVENLARLWERERLLLSGALYLDAREAGREPPSVSQFVSRSCGVLFLDVRDSSPDLGPDALSVDVAKPTAEEQRAAWEMALSDAPGGLARDLADGPARLAGQFNLNLGDIRRIARTSLAARPEPPGIDRLWDACLDAARLRLDALAQRLEPKATRDDLVLPPAESDLLDQIGAQVRKRAKVYETWGFGRRMNRGLGISALFAGESGTGKTMAAEVIANDLRLSLYRIDLSAVVNKYIGETEKNLRRVFDAAEDGGAILFFDEADALFGKRSEVKDSHDRYANIEVNYLLQRMEGYRGLAILATNMKSALDPAFMRRLRFVVNFPFPGPAERLAIWRGAFPPQTPAEGLDFEQLSRINLTGGGIHNIALNAAFMAARDGDGGSVTMPMVLEAARGELRKLGKPINEADFRVARPVEARG